MALPATIYVYGAGVGNGIYNLAPGVDLNGNQFYQTGLPARDIVFYPGATLWAITTVVTGASYPSNVEDYLGPIGDTSTSISLNSWRLNSAGPAAPPPPTLSTTPLAVSINVAVSFVF